MINSLVIGRSSFLHRVAPELKVAAAVIFSTAVALTPRHAFGAFVADLAVVVVLLAVVGFRPGTVLRRATVIAPFLIYAVTLPLLAGGPSTTIGPVEVSTPGLWAAWNTVAKTTIGFGCTLALAGSTLPDQLVIGLQRLRVPAAVVQIVSFLIRYVDLLADESRRTQRAMTARGHNPRWFWQTRSLASATGALFVRTYERGERIHDAMLARGFTGRLPDPVIATASVRAWATTLVLAAVPLMTWTAFGALGDRW